jgi:hypothetical protein
VTAAPLPFTVSELLPEIESLVTVSAADEATFDVVLGEVLAIVVVVAPGAAVVVGTCTTVGIGVFKVVVFHLIVEIPSTGFLLRPAGIFK